MIGAFAKYYHMTPTEVLYELSYENFILFSASIPQYEGTEAEGKCGMTTSGLFEAMSRINPTEI